MADKKIVGIDLGRESLKCVVISVDKGTVRVEACHSEKLALPADAQETAWQSAVAVVLKKWRKDGVIGDETVVVNAPSAHTLIRALKVPTAEMAVKLPEEAKQQLPFPLETLDWDYVVVGEDGSQSHVSLAAIKKDIIGDVLNLLKKASIAPEAINNGALALANLVLRAEGGSCPEPLAVLSMGSTASNLTIVDGTKVWMRTLPVTGLSIVTSLAKGIEIPEEEARTALNRDVNLSGQNETDDSPATKNVRAAITRMVMEITRSFTFYRSQLGGGKPQKLYITGGYSTIPGLCALLAERLKMDVDILDVFKGLEGGTSEKSYLYGEALGCALSGAGVVQYSLSLLPKDVQWQRDFDARKPMLVIAAILLCVMFAGLFVMAYIAKSSIASRDASVRENLEKVQKYNTSIEKIQKNIDLQRKENQELGRILWERDLYTYLLKNVSALMPTNMWLKGIETVTFNDIYTKAITELDNSGYGNIDDPKLMARPVQVIIHGLYYGDWTAKQNEFAELINTVEGIAGSEQIGSKVWRKYTEFDLQLNLDSNNDGRSDLQDIKDVLAAQAPQR